MQQLQFFLSEAAWDGEAINARRLALRAAEPATAPSPEGVLIIDDTGNRKDSSAIDHVARQHLGSVGKIDNGIVAVTTLWADEAHYYPLHGAPYTPEKQLAGGKQYPAFPGISHQAANHTGPGRARTGCGHCLQHHRGGLLLRRPRALEKALLACRLPHVLARSLLLRAWQSVVRRFQDGHTERCWAAKLMLFG